MKLLHHHPGHYGHYGHFDHPLILLMIAIFLAALLLMTSTAF